jgi:hypothetical protein
MNSELEKLTRSALELIPAGYGGPGHFGEVPGAHFK